MKVLVYPHDLGLGGSQLNAIELAAGVRDLGHEVVVFGRAGALNARIEQLGLEFIAAPPPGRRPSPATARALADIVRARGIDVLHGYEWPPSLEATLATRMGADAAVVSTVMSMSIPPFIPRSVPLVVGTEEIADVERSAGRRRVSVIEPPVDLRFNDIEVDPGVERFRRIHGIDDQRIMVVAVARFARELKLEGTLVAIDVIGELAADHPVRLVLVGDGPTREEVQRRAAEVNARRGPGTIILTGALDDPRPAYAAADIALGMGGSALRALAYGLPLIVQGEHGFWCGLEAGTVDRFLWTGWYGVGSGREAGASALARELRPLLDDPHLRAQRGAFGADLVKTRFSLDRAAGIQLRQYELALSQPSPHGALAQVEALGRYSRYYLAKRLRRAWGREAEDDFNSRPVAGRSRQP